MSGADSLSEAETRVVSALLERAAGGGGHIRVPAGVIGVISERI
jgi:hypothetical protein